jgi:hypothetical protein
MAVKGLTRQPQCIHGRSGSYDPQHKSREPTFGPSQSIAGLCGGSTSKCLASIPGDTQLPLLRTFGYYLLPREHTVVVRLCNGYQC